MAGRAVIAFRLSNPSANDLAAGVGSEHLKGAVIMSEMTPRRALVSAKGVKP